VPSYLPAAGHASPAAEPLPGAGDLDVIIYSARKWGRLALAGNPTVLLVLFAPTRRWSSATRPGPSS
jgi:RNA repair pathway DNA polymerase beta family